MAVHRIVRIESFRVSADLPESYRTARGRVSDRATLLVRVEADSGADGWGECAGPAGVAQEAVHGLFAPTAIGEDALQTEVLWNRMWVAGQPFGRRGSAVAALSGIDMALWDLKAKVRGCPASELFGGALRQRLPCAVSGLYFREGPESTHIPDRLDEARRLLDRGFRAVAVQVGRNLSHDRAMVRALRKEFPDAAFTAEASGIYDFPEALAIGRVLEECGFAVFEEPISPEQPELYGRLAQSLRLPISAGRKLQTRFDFERLVSAGGIGVAQLNLAWCGGPTEALRIRAVTSSRGVNLSPITTGTDLALAASAHFLASDFRQPGRAETPPPLLRREGRPDPLSPALYSRRIVDEDGIAEVPEGDGWGVVVDRDALLAGGGALACEIRETT